jgi:hypothetical protein
LASTYYPGSEEASDQVQSTKYKTPSTKYQVQSTKHKVQSTKFKPLARSSQPHRLLNKVVTTRPSDFSKIALFDWKQAAGVGTVLINTAERRAISLLFQERTLKNQLTTCTTSVAITTSQGKRRDCLLLAESCNDETPDLSLSLARAQLRIRDLTRADTLRKTFFKGPLLVAVPFPKRFHQKTND